MTSIIPILPPPIPLGPGQIHDDVLEDGDLELLECFATGTWRQDIVFNVSCQAICQRPENPCIVDIDFLVEGEGEYELVPDLCLFSLDTTNGIDGTWHVLQPVETDPQHCGQFIEVHGSKVFRFVADMCDHISSFFSEPRVCFRITVQEKQDTEGTFGAFNDAGNPDAPGTEPEEVMPTETPKGGCRQRYYGPRFPRA